MNTPKNTRSTCVRAWVLGLLAAGLLGGVAAILVDGSFTHAWTSVAPTPAAMPESKGLPRPAEPALPDLAQTAEHQGPAVVRAATYSSDASDTSAATAGRLGLALRPLQPRERRAAGVEGGLVVEHSSGLAAQAGVQPGDLLLAINGLPIASVAQARDLVARATKSVALLLQRGSERIFVPVRIG